MKDHSIKKDEPEARVELSTLPVPAEVFAVVAEHLIGDHAFATAASLNQTSSSIRYQTLPVLYETLIVGEKGVKDYRRLNGGDKLPTGSQYVKYLFTGQEDDLIGDHGDCFPNLAMVACTVGSRRSFKPTQQDIHLLKSISCATLVSILGEPVTCEQHHESASHAVHANAMQIATHAPSAEPEEILCKRQGGVCARAIGSMRRMYIKEGCKIQSASAVVNSLTYFALDGVDILSEPDMERVLRREVVNETCLAETAIQLMKIASKSVTNSNSKIRCKTKDYLSDPYPVDWDLVVTLSPSGMKSFAQMLSREVDKMPQLLQHRLLYKVTGLTDEPTYFQVLQELLLPYAENMGFLKGIFSPQSASLGHLRLELLYHVPITAWEDDRDYATRQRYPLPQHIDTGMAVWYKLVKGEDGELGFDCDGEVQRAPWMKNFVRREDGRFWCESDFARITPRLSDGT